MKTDKDLGEPRTGETPKDTSHPQRHGLPRIESGAGSCAGHDRVWTWGRPALFILAWLFLAIGVVGLFLPFLPGTLFLILAGACFTRSSPRFEAWLLDHPRFGPPVRAWRATGAVPRRGKVFACLSLALSWLILLGTGAPSAAKAVCLAVFIGVGVYLVTRPER